MLILALLLVAGAALPFAFAPVGIYTFAFISPAILIYCWLKVTPRQAFIRGLFFGLGFFTAGVSWVYISIHVYGHTPSLLAGFITFLFVLVLSLYPATQGYVLNKIFKKNIITKALLAFPATWVFWELLRDWLFTGFPWLFLGYTQTGTILNGLAPLVGVYGLSLGVAMIAGALAVLALRTNNKIKMICVLIIIGIPAMGWFLAKHNWTHPIGDPVQISLVQGNVKQQLKWQPQQLTKIMNEYKTLTAKHWDSKVIVWPEAAIPTFQFQVSKYLSKMDRAAKKHNTFLVLGIPYYFPKTERYYNAMLMIGAGQGLYLKRHLVPFGEYVPLKPVFSKLLSSFKIPMSSFSAGPEEQPTIKINNIAIAAFICYEIAYPEEVLESTKGKQLIITITDDSWFGKSIALNQHLQIAQMRALETGRYLLLGSNTGITAFINPKGKMQAVAPVGKRYVLTSKITAMRGNTPLMVWGYDPILILIVLFAVLALIL